MLAQIMGDENTLLTKFLDPILQEIFTIQFEIYKVHIYYVNNIPDQLEGALSFRISF